MLLTSYLQQMYIPVKSQLWGRYTLFWFSLSLIVPLYFGLISLHYAFSHDYIVQDDTRIDIVWLQRYIDPQLFPNDLIADYYSTFRPAGFKFFYWIIAKFGVQPVIVAKFLPIILGVVTTIYFFKFSLKIFPVPASAFLSTLILNQNFWLKDDLVSATPRSFLYPLFAAFLYYLSQRSLFPCLMAMALQGLFYPPMLLVEIAILTVGLLGWRKGLPRLVNDRLSYIFWLSGFIVTLIFIFIFFLEASNELGTFATATQMKAMPEFGLNGRKQYFGVNPISFIFGGASGLRFPLYPPIIWSCIGLPFLLRYRLPLVKSIAGEVKILLQVFLAALGLFCLSHLLFPRLYFPVKYTFYSFRFVMAIAAGIVLIILLDIWQRWLQKQLQMKAQLNLQQLLQIGLVGLFASAVLIVPAVPSIFLSCQSWMIGEYPKIYQFLASQPKDTLTASLARETDNLPAFAQRSVLVSREFALPFYPVLYGRMQQRVTDIIQAQYSTDLAVTQEIVQKYGIDFLMIEADFLKPDYLHRQDWLINSSFQDVVLGAIAQLEQGATPAVAKLTAHCTAFSEKSLILLDAACIIRAK